MITRIVLLLFLILLPVSSFSQKDSLWQDSVRSEATIFFTKVDRIELVKLKSSCVTKKYPSGIFGRMKKYTMCYEVSLLNCDGYPDSVECSLDTSLIGEKYTLPQAEFDSLFQYLYLFEPSRSRAACYNPRHGILFYDSEEMMIGYLEICFECNRMRSLPNTPNMGPLEGDPFDKLHSLFTENNL